MKDGMSNEQDASALVTTDGTYINFKLAGTTVARINSSGQLELAGGVTSDVSF